MTGYKHCAIAIYTVELLETKSGKSRKVPISSKMMQVLEEAKNDTEYVFVNPDTNMPYNDIKNTFRHNQL